MAHTHPVVDSDSRFIINSTTRAISTASDKLELIQGDHQSERITFEIPKIVEGHDMSLCDRIEIHYINIDKRTSATSRDVYIVDDMDIDGDKLTFSWLISGNATKYYGRLNFIVLFECLDPDGNYTYKWNTEICKLLTVGEGISNTAAVSENYSDILEKFRNEILEEAGEKSIQPDWNQNDSTAADYVKNRPFYTETTEAVLVEERTAPFADSGHGRYTAHFQSTFSATVGETYKVYWDGTAYECTCVIFNKVRAIGNLSISGIGSDTGEPFLIGMVDVGRIDIATKDTSASHTFSISGLVTEVVKIDEKYLPDNPLNITGSTVGQVAKIAAVDASGVPTAWEPVDMPSGGVRETWGLLSDTTIDGDVSIISMAIPPCKKIKAYFEGHQLFSDGSETKNEFTNLNAAFDVDGNQDLHPFYIQNLISRFNSDVVSVIDFDVSTPPFASGAMNRIFPNGHNTGSVYYPVSNEIAITAASAITKITMLPKYKFIQGQGSAGRFASGGRLRIYGVKK